MGVDSMDKITLDRSVFKALASDTRLDILKALDVRQKTVTELAKELGLNKATVFEHLEKLNEVGLIQKLEDDRKWVYWQLSWTGRRLLHPEKITLALLLSSAFATLLTAFAVFSLWVRSNVAPATGEGDMGAFDTGAADSQRAFATEEAAFAPPPEEPAAAAVQHDPALLAGIVVLGLVFLLLVGYATIVWRRAKAARADAAASA
jgi:DNA-binding transcriptional ArsR family regulator